MTPPDGKDSAESGRRQTASWPAALALLPLGLLATAVWFGHWVRPGADDWCFLPQVREDGISGLVRKFYLQDNGRVTNAALTGLYAKFDIAGHQWFAFVSGVTVLGILWAVTALVLRRTGLTVPRGVPLLTAAMVTTVFLLATPNTYKTFYWPASSVSHTLAPVFACAGAIPLLLARSRAGRNAALAAVFVAGLLVGTLSEETTVVVLVVLSAALLLSCRILTDRRRRAYARTWCLTGIAGTVIGALVLVTSPGSQNRRERYGAQGTSVIAPEALIESLRAFAQIVGTLLTTWQYLGAVAAGVLLGLLVRGPAGRSTAPLPHRPLLVCAGVLVFLVSGYLCTVVALPAFGPGVATASRAWNDYLLLYTVLLTAAGALLGDTLRQRARRAGPVEAGRAPEVPDAPDAREAPDARKPVNSPSAAHAVRAANTARAAMAASAAVCALVCVALTVSLGHLGQDMRERARNWDRQDQWMRLQSAHGAQVLPYKPLSVSRMGEPFGKHGSWPASCVADYYYVDKVTHSTAFP
ncbi:DUF6056 family protein [Streptomyces sp. NPDC004838]